MIQNFQRLSSRSGLRWLIYPTSLSKRRLHLSREGQSHQHSSHCEVMRRNNNVRKRRLSIKFHLVYIEQSGHLPMQGYTDLNTSADSCLHCLDDLDLLLIDVFVPRVTTIHRCNQCGLSNHGSDSKRFVVNFKDLWAMCCASEWWTAFWSIVSLDSSVHKAKCSRILTSPKTTARCGKACEHCMEVS